jgi:hypothetical protein
MSPNDESEADLDSAPKNFSAPGIALKRALMPEEGGNRNRSGGIGIPQLPKWEELQTPAQNLNKPVASANVVSGNFGGFEGNVRPLATNMFAGPCGVRPQLVPGLPTAMGGRFRSITTLANAPTQMPNNTPINGDESFGSIRNDQRTLNRPQVYLIPLPMSKNILQWLKPISRHCNLEQFFNRINEQLFLEALNLFSIFYYNRPSNRASISMLMLFKAVMELEGYHRVLTCLTV